jgi:hypothetical protein
MKLKVKVKIQRWEGKGYPNRVERSCGPQGQRGERIEEEEGKGRERRREEKRRGRREGGGRRKEEARTERVTLYSSIQYVHRFRPRLFGRFDVP